MNKLFLPLAFIAIMHQGCSNDKSNENKHDHGDGTHQHDYGTTHSHDSITPSGQEEFSTDTLKNIFDTAHPHDHGHEHPHEHDHKH